MDEQRYDAYINLIQELLRCSIGEESEILNANKQLIDAGLVQIMEQVASILSEHRNQNASDFLQQVAAQLIAAIDNSSEDITFLGEILQATLDNTGNSEAAYKAVTSLLAEKLEKFNDDFAQLWNNWAISNLPMLPLEQAVAIAEMTVFLSFMISDLSQGSRATNLEIQIAGYEIALTVFTSQAFPEDWARTQRNLGVAYYDRIFGKPAENLEKALACHENALQVFNREDFSEDWALTQDNLGNIYGKRMLEKPAENLERAIACYQKALQVYTRNSYLAPGN